MATLYLVCGLPGAGKTTLARKLASERGGEAIRLCPDEWISEMLADPGDTRERDRLREPVERLQWELAQRLLSLGVSVILENGFWSRAERTLCRERAREIGARVELRYLSASRETLLRRLEARDRNLPKGTFRVTTAELDKWLPLFEPPDETELAEYDAHQNRQPNPTPAPVPAHLRHGG